MAACRKSKGNYTMKNIGIPKLIELQKSVENIRNICILAHVDHGKTTLADYLLASNGIISQRMAGKLRYMDSRKDEQERGITMKSSAISLYYDKAPNEFLINLIDSPGHVDFSSEVSTAIRLCDGAIIIVDAVEGLCPQTKSVLYQAWQENLTPVLVLNKIDRLITELKLTPIEAHLHLQQILEQVNAVTGELFTVDVMKKADEAADATENDNPSDAGKDVYQYGTGFEETDDSHIYFSPDRGNVIFASALDGWGFAIEHFAEMYSKKLGIKSDILCKTLWGDFYLNSKSKKIMKEAQSKGKKSLFTQFILENIWAVYEAFYVKRDTEMMDKIIKSLNLKVDERCARTNDFKTQLSNIFSQWLPLDKAVLDMVVNILPSPKRMSVEKAEKLLCKSSNAFDSIPEATRSLKEDIISCDSSSLAPVLIYISKMFAIPKQSLPQFSRKPLTQEEILQRKEQARQWYADKKKVEIEQVNKVQETDYVSLNLSNTESEVNEEEVFIAFAKIFSGTIKKGQQLFVLGPKYDPGKALREEVSGLKIDPSLTVKDLSSNCHITCVTIDTLFMFMGRELVSLNEVPAGNILGIGGLEDHVLKSATLSSTVACPSFVGLNFVAKPIVRVAVEPKIMSEMGKLVKGMKLLNQADPCVQMFVQETGEHVLVTLGEVHLQRCLDDLQERFAKTDIVVSAPIVPFRETIIPKGDATIENNDEKSTVSKQKQKEASDETTEPELVEIKTANKQCSFKIKALSLPSDVTNLLEQHTNLIKVLHHYSISRLWDKNSDTSKGAKMTLDMIVALNEFKQTLSKAFEAAGVEWLDIIDRIWSFGPRHCGPNLLINNITNYERPSVWHCIEDKPFTPLAFHDYANSVVTGFQMATLAGPLCEEPMMGVAFIVSSWDNVEKSVQKMDILKEIKPLNNSENIVSESSSPKTFIDKENQCNKSQLDSCGPLSGQIISAVKEGCRRAFQIQPQRLMAAMYSCIVQSTADVLGKIYGVISKRSGRVLNEDLQLGSQIFKITAVLPVVESFGFAEEIRKKTSGLGNPQLVFSHWEVIQIDPFWVPSTEEEYEHFGDKADSENRALKYMNDVRRRKGLAVEQKTVERAEKQRTLTRNK